MSASRTEPSAENGTSPADPRSSPRLFTQLDRLRIGIGSRVGYLAIGLIGPTLRWETRGIEHLTTIHESGHRAIFTFWHGGIFPATWFWRRRGIVVMTSLNRDGEIIAGCIRRHGYGAARGSSSRAGFRALAEMARSLKAGLDVAFTIDGPRGPRYVAKQGPVILARKTGAGILCFHIGLRRRIQLDTWDHFQIPLPFSRARVSIAPPIWVPRDATEDQVRRTHARVQELLDDLRRESERWETGV